ncbi:Rap1 GTPase-GDP dissociation stimulator 1, partial [Coemansia sp. RSA 2618]
PVPVAQAAFGAVLNVSLDYAECTQALLAAGALAPHVAVLRDGGALPVWPLVCSSLDNLCESDEAPAQFEQHAGLAQEMLQALADISQRLAANKAGGANGDDEDTNSVLRGTQRTLLWILCEVLEKSGGVRQQLCQPACVLQLFGILEYYVTAGDAGESDEAQSPEDPAASAMAQPPNRPLPQSNRFADAAAQMIVGISGEDQALSMFDDTALQQRMFGLLQQSQEALAAAAALCLGNLARTDAHCTRLVADHADVVRAAVAWFERGEVRVRHAASGLLKNLCLPVSAKQQMVDFGLAAVAARSIDTAVVPVQANSIGILRHLIAGPAASVVRALLGSDSDSKSAGSDAAANSECALAKLLAAVRGTDIDGIRCEGTRLVAAVVKAVYLKRTVDARALEACGFDLVAPLVRLIVLDGQRHPLLQQESLVALSVLVPASTARAPYAETVVRLLGSTEGELPAIAELDSEDADEAKEAKEAAARPDSFATVLKRLLTQDGPVWPQSTMQAKSLVTQLAAKVDDTYDAAGLQAFNSEIIPLTLDK